ncbi:pyridoxamine 5'-phosphate oxidase family protein [Paremcibacter congregatus]|uniref:pyridoxamine 5'-phosphate oxidase family protein n=1 Tax=Paremcibacter congregatus TaxID=2043170 RepID=UPI003A9361BC
MGHKFAEIAFTETVRTLQTEMGSRTGYADMDEGEDYNNLMSTAESDFIAARDSFYMATVSETGWPYIQHRGGPQGFVKILNATTIGFADYAGNRQYVSTGNLLKDDRISLFFMDYPNRRRLKILGRVSLVPSDDLETLPQLEDDHFRAPVERAFLIKIEAFDWNCPKYITPRYTEKYVEALIAPLQKKIELLRSGDQPSQTLPKVPNEIGTGPLPLVITAIRQEAENIRSYELCHPDGAALPPVKAGAHIQVPVVASSGDTIWRFYSICSDPVQKNHYQIAVLNQPDGRGGSPALHSEYQVGMRLTCYRPDNYFALQSEKHKKGSKAVFIAGGIGITPIRAMVLEAEKNDYACDLHYAARSNKSSAFTGDFTSLGDRAHIYFSEKGERLDLHRIFAAAAADTIHYLCGPPAMLQAARSIVEKLGLKPSSLIFEAFEE